MDLREFLCATAQVECKSKVTVVRVYAMVSYKVSGGVNSFIFNLSTKWLNDHRHVPAALALVQGPVNR